MRRRCQSMISLMLEPLKLWWWVILTLIKVTYCWTLLHLPFFVNRDMLFKESIIPFQTHSTTREPLFQHIATPNSFKLASPSVQPPPILPNVPPSLPPPLVVELRHSTRVRTQPALMTDFITASSSLSPSTPHPISSSLTCSSLHASYRSSIASLPL